MKRIIILVFLGVCVACGYAKPRATVLTLVQRLCFPGTEPVLEFKIFLRNDSDQTISVVTNQSLWENPSNETAGKETPHFKWNLRAGMRKVFGVRIVPSETELNIVRLRKGEYCSLMVAVVPDRYSQTVDIEFETDYIVEKEIIERFGVDDLEVTYLYEDQVHRVIGNFEDIVLSDTIKAFFDKADP